MAIGQMLKNVNGFNKNDVHYQDRFLYKKLKTENFHIHDNAVRCTSKYFGHVLYEL